MRPAEDVGGGVVMDRGGANLTSGLAPYTQRPRSSPPQPGPSRIRGVLVMSNGGRTRAPPVLQTLWPTLCSPWALGPGTAGVSGNRTRPRRLGGSQVKTVGAVPSWGPGQHLSSVPGGRLGVRVGARPEKWEGTGWGVVSEEEPGWPALFSARLPGFFCPLQTPWAHPTVGAPPCAPRRF